MITKRLIFTLFAALIVLTNCVHTPAAPTSTPEPTLPATISAPTSTPELTLPVSISSPTSTPNYLSPLFNLYIFAGGTGWAGNLNQTVFYNTRNISEHWLTVTPTGMSAEGSGWGTNTSFLDGETAWICQTQSDLSATLYATIDGGLSWQTHNLDFPCGQMSLLNANEGYILSDLGVGAGSQYVSLYYTADGGQSWDLRFEHDPADPDDHGLPTGGIKSHFGFLSSNIGLVGGSVPIPGAVYLFRTINGGFSWNQSGCQGLPVDENQETSVDKVIQIDATTAILPVRSYLFDGNSVTYFCSTTDAGENWQYVGTIENVEFFDFGSLLTGVAYGQGKMWQTEDGGATWTETSSGLPSEVTPVSLEMTDDLVGFLTATITPETLLENRIYMTANNGKDWQAMPVNIIESP